MNYKLETLIEIDVLNVDTFGKLLLLISRIIEENEKIGIKLEDCKVVFKNINNNNAIEQFKQLTNSNHDPKNTLLQDDFGVDFNLLD